MKTFHNERKKGNVSNVNSTTLSLSSGQTFTGTYEHIEKYSSVSVLIIIDTGSAEACTLNMDLSIDTTNTRTKSVLIDAESPSAHTLAVISQFFRIRVEADQSTSVTGAVQVIYHEDRPQGLTSFISETINGNNDAVLTRSVLVGEDTESGSYSNIKTTKDGSLFTSIQDPLSAFGDLRVADLTPIAQYTFPYIINDRLLTDQSTNSGALSISSSMIKCSTGTTTNSVAGFETIKKMKYRAGEGILIRFTAIFSSPVADTKQYIGYFDDEDGLMIGYEGNTFQIVRINNSVDTTVAQANWNIDPADGTKTLPVMNWQRGNVFEIQIQYLGFGRIIFRTENPNSGKFTNLHVIDYANTATVPHLRSASLPFKIYCFNDTTTSDMIMYSASAGLFTEGRIENTPITNAFSGSASGITTETILINLRAKTTWGAHENHVETYLSYITSAMSSAGTRNVTYRIVLNGTLASASWSDVSAGSSSLEKDTSATVTSGSGTTLFTWVNATDTSSNIDLSSLKLFFVAGDTLSVTASAGSAVDPSVSLIVFEDV